jgi:N-methylhydantoinase A
VYFGPAASRRDTRVVTRGFLGAEPLAGPLVIEEYEGTAVVPPDCKAFRDPTGNIVIHLPH